MKTTEHYSVPTRVSGQLETPASGALWPGMFMASRITKGLTRHDGISVTSVRHVEPSYWNFSVAGVHKGLRTMVHEPFFPPISATLGSRSDMSMDLAAA